MTQKKKIKINNDKLEQFQNQQIDLLCFYKQCNPDETVYLTDEDFSKAHTWYNKMQYAMQNQLPSNIKKSLESIEEKQPEIVQQQEIINKVEKII